jgi:hypothetical protein
MERNHAMQKAEERGSSSIKRVHIVIPFEYWFILVIRCIARHGAEKSRNSPRIASYLPEICFSQNNNFRVQNFTV